MDGNGSSFNRNFMLFEYSYIQLERNKSKLNERDLRYVVTSEVRKNSTIFDQISHLLIFAQLLHEQISYFNVRCFIICNVQCVVVGISSINKKYFVHFSSIFDVSINNRGKEFSLRFAFLS